MRKIKGSVFLSVDGFMQAPGANQSKALEEIQAKYPPYFAEMGEVAGAERLTEGPSHRCSPYITPLARHLPIFSR